MANNMSLPKVKMVNVLKEDSNISTPKKKILICNNVSSSQNMPAKVVQQMEANNFMVLYIHP